MYDRFARERLPTPAKSLPPDSLADPVMGGHEASSSSRKLP